MFARRYGRHGGEEGGHGGLRGFLASGRFGRPGGSGHGHGHGYGHGHGDDEAGDRRGGRPFGGRVFGQGDLRLVLLALIAEQPRHGYELIKAIEEKFAGGYAPSPGAIYPTLTLLEEQDYIVPVAEGADNPAGGKKRYTITEAGRSFLEANRAQLDGILARIAMLARALTEERAPEAVRQAMHTLKHALRLRRGPWSEAETARILAILERAAREIAGG